MERRHLSTCWSQNLNPSLLKPVLKMILSSELYRVSLKCRLFQNLQPFPALQPKYSPSALSTKTSLGDQSWSPETHN